MRSLALCAWIGASLALVPAPVGRDGGQVRIGLDVDLVVFNGTVTDSRGRPVAGLQPGDFRVVEDGRVQEIKLFSATDGAASVGLVIDSSGSMRTKHADVARAALAFVGASDPRDEMFVVTFNERVDLGLPPEVRFTRDPDLIRAAILRQAPDGLTALYDALAVGIEHVNTGTHDRKALVVLSDGGDNASRRRLDDVLEVARRSSATIYTIGIYDEMDVDRNPRVLKTIASASGGRAYFPQYLVDLEGVWRDIAGAIRSQYTIGYYSTNRTRDGRFRKVAITAGRGGGRNLRVTTRAGYVAPTDGFPGR